MASTSASIPYFQRAWYIAVYNQQGNPPLVLSSNDMEQPLRAIFTVNKMVNTIFWDAEVVLYNVNSSTINTFKPQATIGSNEINWNSPAFNLGTGITVSAGYKNSSFGPFNPRLNQIYGGIIFQPLWTREDVVDTKLTLRCLLGMFEGNWNLVNETINAGATDLDIAYKVAEAAKITLDVPNDSDKQKLSNQKYSRSQTVFGRPNEKFASLAKDNGMSFWGVPSFGPNGEPQYKITLRSLEFNPNVKPDYVYAPTGFPMSKLPSVEQQGSVKPTIIGTPEQTQDGIKFRVLLDSQVQLGQIVQVAPGTAISRIPITIGQLPARLDQKGNFVVNQIRHFGDTRGGDTSWYTEISGLSYQFYPFGGMADLLSSVDRTGK